MNNISSYLQDFFFFQAEDGIRDIGVTGVQTCALPICTHLPLLSDSTSAARPPRTPTSAAVIRPRFSGIVATKIAAPPAERAAVAVMRSLMAGRTRAMNVRGKTKSRDQPSDAREPRKTPSIAAGCQVTQTASAAPR